MSGPAEFYRRAGRRHQREIEANFNGPGRCPHCGELGGDEHRCPFILADEDEHELVDHCPVCLSAPGEHSDACPLRPDDELLVGVWAGGFTSGATAALRTAGMGRETARRSAYELFAEFVNVHDLHSPEARQRLAQMIRDAGRVMKMEHGL